MYIYEFRCLVNGERMFLYFQNSLMKTRVSSEWPSYKYPAHDAQKLITGITWGESYHEKVSAYLETNYETGDSGLSVISESCRRIDSKKQQRREQWFVEEGTLTYEIREWKEVVVRKSTKLSPICPKKKRERPKQKMNAFTVMAKKKYIREMHRRIKDETKVTSLHNGLRQKWLFHGGASKSGRTMDRARRRISERD